MIESAHRSFLQRAGIDTVPGRTARDWFRIASTARKMASLRGETFQNVVRPVADPTSDALRDQWEWV